MGDTDREEQVEMNSSDASDGERGAAKEKPSLNMFCISCMVNTVCRSTLSVLLKVLNNDRTVGGCSSTQWLRLGMSMNT